MGVVGLSGSKSGLVIWSKEMAQHDGNAVAFAPAEGPFGASARLLRMCPTGSGSNAAPIRALIYVYFSFADKSGIVPLALPTFVPVLRAYIVPRS